MILTELNDIVPTDKPDSNTSSQAEVVQVDTEDDTSHNSSCDADSTANLSSMDVPTEGVFPAEGITPVDTSSPNLKYGPKSQQGSDTDNDQGTSDSSLTSTASLPTRGTMLPWGVHKERPSLPPAAVDTDLKPGEFVMRTLFIEFTVQAERKMELVMTENLEKPLSKILQRGEDPQLDQILCAFGTVAEHCLPSLLRALFGWLEKQMQHSSHVSDQAKKPQQEKNKSIMYIVSGSGPATEPIERSLDELQAERRDLAVEFLFCLGLIEVLKQLPFHPGHEDLVQYIENLAFKHFNYKEGIQSSPNAMNIHIIADLYAEVIGVLAQSRFMAVRKRFITELKELMSREPSTHVTQSIIALLMGMKFFRVKMVPIEEFEASFQFLQECAQYFLDVKDKDIKHAFAGLFVEILVPVAATVKNEVNVPCLKNFVEMLYTQTLDYSTKSKHRLALFPLVTCLLCVSQKTFFLANWHYFLAMCLNNLKNRDPKMCRVALESLYRLLWVYMIRIKCESNSATQSRLQSIVNSLFPKGSKGVVPRDTPLNIFVKIIQFIAQERLDFAMREIVFDLLMVGRPIKMILTPERMSIGLRAFLVVADSLQQKEGEPPMPRTTGTMPSGNTLRVKKTFLNKVLTDETARSIGMIAYFPFVRRIFVDILRALDLHYGRPLIITNSQNITKEQEINTGDRKPRIDLFRTCIAAVPRLIPDGMSAVELVEMLSRMTVHIDEELRALAYQSLQILVVDFADWRQDVLSGFTQFLAKEVQDTFPTLVENGLRMLLQLVTSWKNTVNTGSVATAPGSTKPDPAANVIHMVEALAMSMLCQCKPFPRKLAVHILREAKLLLEKLCLTDETPVIDAMDSCCANLGELCLPLLPPTEKQALLAASQLDLQWFCDRTHSIWTPGNEEGNGKSGTNVSPGPPGADPWGKLLIGFMERNQVPMKCPTAVHHAWPILHSRINTLYVVIDPMPVSDNRASLLRSATAPRKPANERDLYMHIWKNYLTLAYRVVPPTPSSVVRCASPDLSLSNTVCSWVGNGSSSNTAASGQQALSTSLENLNISTTGRFTLPLSYGRKDRQHKRTSSSPDSLSGERSDSKSPGGGASPCALYKLTVPLLKCELADVRDVTVHAIGHVNSDALKDLMEELLSLIREAVDRKQENMRRRRRRDALRLHLGKVLQLIAENGTFANSSSVLENGSLHPTFLEYIDGARLCLESETEKDAPAVQEIKLIFCNFVTQIIKSFPLEKYVTLLKRDLRKNLFQLFAGWTGQFAKHLGPFSPPPHLVQSVANDADKTLQFAALQAMSAMLYCGSCFTPIALSEDGPIYPWLHQLLASQDEKIYQLGTETIILLLDMNHDIGPLLDWVIDKCYTGEPRVADGAFLALATIFSTREYPCDHYTAVINVTLMCTGCPRPLVHETALQLLQLLDKRFFGNVNLLPADGDPSKAEHGTLDILLSKTYCRSQLYLSKQLSQLHPEMTMPMISEITHRFQTARPEVRQLLPQYMLPWLINIELVDPNVPPANPLSYFQYCTSEPSRSGGRREGMGSAEATEMVLNNLFYITSKFSDYHPKEIEELWATLCSCWPNNLKIIMRYLIIISGMAPNELLPIAKRVALYLARSRPERLLDEMMSELQTVETLNCLIERTETPPFYRLTSMRKASSHSDNGNATNGNGNSGARGDLTVEKGTIHTKRHSGEDPIKQSSKLDSGLRSGMRGTDSSIDKKAPLTPLPQRQVEEPTSPCVDHDSTKIIGEFSLNRGQSANNTSVTSSDGKFDTPPQPHPLPMPEFGGYFAPLTEYLPDSTQPISGFHRCNVAVILLCDIVLDGVDIDWSIHVPLMLHIIFLGLDHTRPLVHEHCKQLLLNLLVTVAAHNDHLTVARLLLNSRTSRLGLGLPIPQLPVVAHNFTEPDAVFDGYLQGTLPAEQLPSQSDTESFGYPSLPPVIVTKDPENTSIAETHKSNDSITTEIEVGNETKPPCSTNNLSGVMLPPLGADMTTPDVIKSLIHFLSTRPYGTPLWNYEDITAKVWSVRSCCQLNTLLQHILKVFRESLPQALISERWAQTALQLGLSCSSRHYAGRSLQVFRSIGVAMTGRMVSDILSRLVETVAEQGEDMQGYVTELLLTLEAAVDSLESNFKPLDFMREIFKSTPNLNNKDTQGNILSTGGKRSPGGCGGCMTNHTRSTSYSVSYCMRKNTQSSSNDCKERGRGCSEMNSKVCPNLCRSRSAQSLKMLGDSATQDDKLTILSTLFWVGVSLLESDYEHEFLLGVGLLSRVMHRLPLDRPDARDRVDRLQSQLRWNNFPGVHALLLKGCTHPATYEPVVKLLSELTPLLELSVIDPTQCLAFPMNVVALLPYMLLHYEDANETCVRAAIHIAQVSAEKSKKLENLGTVMTLYSLRTFSKESFQWTKCVVKYLWDTYAHMSLQMLTFLVEVLEKGAPCLQLSVLSILHCMLHYVDLNASTAQPINADLLRVIAKFIDGGNNYKEAMKILKLVVTRCSTLVVPPHWDTTTTSIIDPELQIKKELPGRTMDFTFDLSQTPVIGRKYIAKGGSTGPNSLTTITPGDKSNAGSGPSSVSGTVSSIDDMGLVSVASVTDAPETGEVVTQENVMCHSPRRSMSLSPADNTNVSGWKKPWMSQARVRECLVNLLTTCGQRVGLPKSPSVIFSQSSELLERESSMASSLEEVSGGHGDFSGGSKSHDAPTDHFGVFKDFDFLEYESESIEGESSDNFNWGVRRQPVGGNDGINAEVISTDASSFTSQTLPLPHTPVNLSTPKAKIVSGEESSDEEVGSESQLYENYIHDSSAIMNMRGRTHSVSSGSSGGDVTPCNAISPALVGRPLSNILFRNPNDDVWRTSLISILKSTSHTQPVILVHKLYNMIKDIISKTIILCEEGSGFLSVGVNSALCTVVELLNAVDPPLIWAGAELIDCSKLSESLCYATLEMDEHLETFFDRKDHAHECVASARGSVLCDEVGKGLYKLLFQLLLIMETYSKMVTVIYNMAMSKSAIDGSGVVVSVREALVHCVEAEAFWASEASSNSQSNSCDDAALVSLLNQQRWYTALTVIRERNAEKITEKGDIVEDEITVLLHIYCEALLANHSDMVIITRSVTDLSEDLLSLRENLFKVSSALKAPHTDRIHSV